MDLEGKFLERYAGGETPEERLGQIIGFFFLSLVPVTCWMRIRWEGIEHVPRDGPAVIAPNHVSVADGAAAAGPIYLTQRCRMVQYMAARDLFRGHFGPYLRLFSCIPVTVGEGDWEAYRMARASLDAGRILGVFPEGGVNRDGRLRPFTSGAALIALSAGVPLVPVTINGSYDCWPRSHVWPRPGRIEVIYHPPIPCQEIRHKRWDRDAVDEITARLEAAVRSRYRPPRDSRDSR